MTLWNKLKKAFCLCGKSAEIRRLEGALSRLRVDSDRTVAELLKQVATLEARLGDRQAELVRVRERSKKKAPVKRKKKSSESAC